MQTSQPKVIMFSTPTCSFCTTAKRYFREKGIRFTDVDVILQDRAKLIELDSNGNFKQIRFSGRLDYVPLLKDNQLKIFYKALIF